MEEKKELYISCCKCKLVEDTFVINEESPEDFGWTNYRGKWYCSSCTHDISRITNENITIKNR